MPGNNESTDKRTARTLLLPFCESTGVSPEQKKLNDKDLELEAWKARKKKER